MHPTSPRAPQEKICAYEYTVRRGDSFYLIANRLGIPLRDLLEANSDVNPARLMVGDVLCIPMEEDDAPAVPEQPLKPDEPDQPDEPLPSPEDNLDAPAVEEDDACPEANRYTLSPGETAADVQLQRNLNRYTLQAANPETDLDHLSAGQTLCIPNQNLACPARRTYTLQSEDTLESVALRLDTSLAALLRANPCLAPADFKADACIRIP